MKAKILTVLLLITAQFHFCHSKRYDGFSLYSVVTKEIDQLKFLQNLMTNKYIDVVFWHQPFKLFQEVQFLVNPIDKPLFLERAKHFNMTVDLHQTDVQTVFDQQYITPNVSSINTRNWDTYHTLNDTYQWLSELAKQYPETVNLESIGQSIEGRDIYALEIRSREIPKGTVFVEAGIHGNEWISTEIVTYLANQLIHANPSTDSLISEVLVYDWVLVPIVNPDGYVYSQEEDRLWRKNRRRFESSYGVDLNRNFESSFGRHGTSNDTNDQNYCGSAPFSEPESKALAEFITNKTAKLQYYFAFHSYGQKLVIPYSDRIAHMDNYEEAENFGKQAILKMFKVSGVKYSLGTCYDTLAKRETKLTKKKWRDALRGSIPKLVNYSKKGTIPRFVLKFVYTFFLRDNGTYGYALPSSEILPTCKETIAGLLELMTTKPKKLMSSMFEYSGQVSPRLATILIYFVCLFLINK